MIKPNFITLIANVGAHFSSKCHDRQVFHVNLAPNEVCCLQTVHHWHPELGADELSISANDVAVDQRGLLVVASGDAPIIEARAG